MKYEVTDDYFEYLLHTDCEKEIDEDMITCPHCNKDIGEEGVIYRLKPILKLINE